MNNQSSIGILNECRDLLIKRIRNVITRVMDELDDALLAMAFSKSNELSEGLCIDAVREIHMKKDEIKTRFERRYISLFNGSVSSWRQDEGVDFDPARLEVLEKLNAECQEDLQRFSSKASELLDVSEGLLKPVGPQAIYIAFEDACSDIQSGAEVRELLFNIFDKYAVNELKNIYIELNDLISSQAVSQSDADNTLEQEEQQVILIRYLAMSVLEKQIKGYQLPTFVRVFLFKHWRTLLEKIYLDQGQENPVWDKALETVDDLVSSVQNVTSEDERKRLSWMLPSLIFRLRNGMRIASVPIVEKTNFLNKLKAHHLGILEERSEMKASYSAFNKEVETNEPQHEELSQLVTAENASEDEDKTVPM